VARDIRFIPHEIACAISSIRSPTLPTTILQCRRHRQLRRQHYYPHHHKVYQ